MIARRKGLSSPSLLLPLLLVLADYAASSITLSQFQEIQGFSSSCESVWQEAIPGCTKQDFASDDNNNNNNTNTCSRSCLAGVNIINAEVLVACSDARVDSNTLLGEFLAGYGVFALCGGGETGSQTIGGSTTTSLKTVESSPGADSTATASITSTYFSSGTITTAIQSTSSTQSAQSSPLSTTAASATSTSLPKLTIAFSGSSSSSVSSTTTTATMTATSSTSSASSSSDPEAKGFGGVGNAFDILGGESGAAQLEMASLGVATLMAVMAGCIARRIW